MTKLFDLNAQPQQAVTRKAEQKQEYKFHGSVKLHKGCKLYSFNTETLMLEEVKIERKVALSVTDKKPVKQSRVNFNPKCLYLQAINIENAKRKVLKLIEKERSKQDGKV